MSLASRSPFATPDSILPKVAPFVAETGVLLDW